MIIPLILALYQCAYPPTGHDFEYCATTCAARSVLWGIVSQPSFRFLCLRSSEDVDAAAISLEHKWQRRHFLDLMLFNLSDDEKVRMWQNPRRVRSEFCTAQKDGGLMASVICRYT